jgi:hypothetical protein
MAECPHCGEKIEIRIIGADGLTREKTTIWDRLASRRTGRFETTATSIAAQRTESARASLGAGPLENGEKRSAKRFRAIDLGDVATSGARAVGTAFAATVISSCGLFVWNWIALDVWPGLLITLRLPLWMPLVVGPAYGAWAWIRADQGMGQDMTTSEETLTRHDEMRDRQANKQTAPKQEPIPVALSGKGERTRPQTIYIPTPDAGPYQMARWFWRIVRKDGVGFSQRVAHNYGGITTPEVKAIQSYFGERDLIKKEGTGNHVVPNEDGLDTMWGVVTRYYPDAVDPRLSPEDAHGVL